MDNEEGTCGSSEAEARTGRTSRKPRALWCRPLQEINWDNVILSFLLLWLNIWDNQLKRREIYFGSWLQRHPCMMTLLLWVCHTAARAHGRECCSRMVARKQRERSPGSQQPLLRHDPKIYLLFIRTHPPKACPHPQGVPVLWRDKFCMSLGKGLRNSPGSLCTQRIPITDQFSGASPFLLP